jgi:hypothetical protein
VRQTHSGDKGRGGYRDWLFSMFIGFAVDQALENIGQPWEAEQSGRGDCCTLKQWGLFFLTNSQQLKANSSINMPKTFRIISPHPSQPSNPSRKRGWS